MSDERTHRCVAKRCAAVCEAKMLMCPLHWFMVPKPLQQRVWDAYVEGQGVTVAPSDAWQRAAQAAIDHVAEREERMTAPLPSGRNPLLAITVHQPWASLIALGDKTIENRDWLPPPDLVGKWVAIHAGKKFDRNAWAVAAAQAANARASQPFINKFTEWSERALNMTERAGKTALQDVMAKAVPYGAIIALVRLKCVWDEKTVPPDSRLWFVGQYAWELEAPTVIDPEPCSGQQGLWPVVGDTLIAVRRKFKIAVDALQNR